MCMCFYVAGDVRYIGQVVQELVKDMAHVRKMTDKILACVQPP